MKKKKMIINSYRRHKQYDMITLKGINNINEVLKYKGQNIYIKKEDLKLDDIELVTEIEGFKVFDQNKYIGKVLEILKIPHNNLLVIINDKNKKIYIPYVKEFIIEINKKEHKIIIKSIKGMIE